MKVTRIVLAVIFCIPAIIFLLLSVVGLINILGGASIYGSQRTVASLLLWGLFLVIAYLLWPLKKTVDSKLAIEFESLPDCEKRADFIASITAARLGVSNDRFSSLLSTDLNFSPREVMSLWDELADDYGVDISAADFPEINSIDDLRTRLSDP